MSLNKGAIILGTYYPNTGIDYPNTGTYYPNTRISYPNTGIGCSNTRIGYPNTGIGCSNTGIGYPVPDNLSRKDLALILLLKLKQLQAKMKERKMTGELKKEIERKLNMFDVLKKILQKCGAQNYKENKSYQELVKMRDCIRDEYDKS